MSNRVQIILRVGAALALLYPPFAALSDPISWAAYFPAFIRALPVETTLLLHAFGLVEAVLAVWLLSGWRIRIPAALATVLLVAIVVFNPAQFEILFRDLSIAAITLALALWPQVAQPSERPSQPPSPPGHQGGQG